MTKIAHVIDAVIRLRDQFSATLKNVNGNLSEFQRQAAFAGKNMVSVGKDMSSVGKTLSLTVTAPIVAAGAGLLKLAENFESAENTIRTSTGATGKSLEGLNNDFKAVYSRVTASMSDTSAVIAGLNQRTGLSGKPLQNLSVQLLQLAKVSKEDINTLIPATTRMFQDAGIKQADYAKALDYTWKVSQNTGIGVSRLQELMTQFGGPLRQMGFNWQTSAAMLGKFEKEGVNTELVVGSMRIALGKMAKSGKDPAKALQDMIEKIKTAGSVGKANALALSMFGARAGPDMASAIREGHMDLAGLIKTLKNSPETVSAATKATQKFSDQLTILKHQTAIQLEPLGTELLVSMQNMLPTIKELLSGFDNLVKRFTSLPKSQQEMIIKFAAFAAVAGPAILMLGKITTTIGETIKPFAKLSRQISKAGGIMAYLATPGGIVLVVITAIAVAAFLLIKYWKPISTFFKKIWADILDVTQKVWAFIGPTIMGAVSKIRAFWNSVWPELKQVLKVVFIAFAVIVGPQILLIYTIIKVALGVIKAVWKDVWNVIKDELKFVWDLIVGMIRIYWDIFSGIFKVALDLLTGHWGKAWTDMKTMFKNLWNDIKSLFGNMAKDAVNYGKDFIQGLIDGIKGAIGGVVDAVKGIGSTIRKFLHFSVPDEGPLRDYMTWMPDMLKGMSQGIKVNTHLVTDKVKDVAVGIKASVQHGTSSVVGSSRTGRVINIAKLADTLIVREESDIDKIAQALAIKLGATAVNMG